MHFAERARGGLFGLCDTLWWCFVNGAPGKRRTVKPFQYWEVHTVVG